MAGLPRPRRLFAKVLKAHLVLVPQRGLDRHRHGRSMDGSLARLRRPGEHQRL